MQDGEKTLNDNSTQMKDETKNLSASKKKAAEIKIELKSLD